MSTKLSEMELEDIQMIGLSGKREEYRYNELYMRADLIYRLVALDKFLGRAIINNKIPMAAYHYGGMKPLLDIVGRSKELKKFLPAWVAWNQFVKDFKRSGFY